MTSAHTASAPVALQANSACALDRIRAYIAEHRIADGGRLPTERDLAAGLQVSRRAVRRALDVLEQENLVWRRQGSGTYLGMAPRLPSPAAVAPKVDFAQFMEVRLQIEPQLAGLAALRATGQDIAGMRQLLLRIEEAAGDADAEELWDAALHRLIARSTGNLLFLSMFELVNQVRQADGWQEVRARARRTGSARHQAMMQHQAIVEAIAAGNAGAATAAMHDHLQMLQDNLARQAGRDAGPQTGTARDTDTQGRE